MNINLCASPTTATPPTKTLDLRLNRNADGVTILEARGTSGDGTTNTPWTPILSFPTGREDGLPRLRRETNLPFSLGSFINTTGGNNSILMIRTGNLD